MSNYVRAFFTHQMTRKPRSIAQFPSKLKFKYRMSRHKQAHRPQANIKYGKAVWLPTDEEVKEMRKDSPWTQDELMNMTKMGPARRLLSIGDDITKLVRDERIEGRHLDLEETRLYTELLLQLVIANGDRHRPTMEMVDFYIKDKALIPKLFNELAPRFKTTEMTYTNFFRLPPESLKTDRKSNLLKMKMRGILELKGNPWPAVMPKPKDQSGLITNVLMKAARDRREAELQKKAAANVSAKVQKVKTSMEAPAPAFNFAPASVDSPVQDNPYRRFAPNSLLTSQESEEDSSIPEERDTPDDNDINIKLKNLNISLSH